MQSEFSQQSFSSPTPKLLLAYHKFSEPVTGLCMKYQISKATGIVVCPATGTVYFAATAALPWPSLLILSRFATGIKKTGS